MWLRIGSSFTQGECSTRTGRNSLSNEGRSGLASCIEVPNGRMSGRRRSPQYNSHTESGLLNRTPLENISNVAPHAKADRFGTFLSKKASSLGYTEVNVKIPQQTSKAKQQPVGRAGNNLENIAGSIEKGNLPDNSTLADVLLAMKNGTRKKKRLQKINSAEPSSNTFGAGDVHRPSFVADRHVPVRKKSVSRITSYSDIQHCSITIDMDAGP